MATISQTFNFPSNLTYKRQNEIGGDFGNNGQGVDFRLRNGNGVFYLTEWTLTRQTLTIGFSNRIRPGGNLGNRGFSDNVLRNGLFVVSQSDRTLPIEIATGSFSGNNYIIDVSSLETDDFINRFSGSSASVLELRDTPLPFEYDPFVGWAAEINGIGLTKSPFRLWSGEGSTTISGKSYQGTTFSGGGLIAVENAPISVGDNTTRAKITIAVPTSAIREMLSIDVGPVWVEAFNIISNDNGKTWIRLPTGIAGRLSKPFFDVEGSLYNVEIETYSGDADRGVPKLWSDENQRNDYPEDLGFEFMRNYETGIDIKWPP